MTTQSVRPLLTMLAVAAAMIFTPMSQVSAEASGDDGEARTVLITGANRGLGLEATLSPEESITGMRKVIDGLTIEDTGTFQSWDGENRKW